MTRCENPAAPAHIASAADLDRGLDVLRHIDPSLALVADGLADIPLRNRAPGFAGLAEIVIAQQVSKAAAGAMTARLEGLISPLEPARFLSAGEQPLIEAGLSRAKQTTLTGLANLLESGALDLESLCARPVEEARTTLTALKGIGPWTADVFLLFCAGHPDIFPAGDVALQHAAGWVAETGEKPSAAETEAIARRWQPVRSVAARVLYAFYADRKGRSALPV